MNYLSHSNLALPKGSKAEGIILGFVGERLPEDWRDNFRICWGEIARVRTQTSHPLGKEIDHPTLMPNHEK